MSTPVQALSQGRRRLAAIMFTDMVGYTALGQKDESLSLALVDEQKKLVRPILKRHEGREVKTIGDSFLVEFDSALDAVRCAVEIQSQLHNQLSSRKDWKIRLRIGIHLGDVVHEGGDVFGDAVNIASRIEPIGEPEGICVSQQVYDQVQNKFELLIMPLGEKSLKNVSKPIGVFRVQMPWEEKSQPASLDVHRIAVMPFANMSPDPSDEYFADGMTEELISSISNIGGLSVISRTSVMKFKGGGRTVGEIGQELKAGTLLEGSVRKAGNLVRVNAQLVDVNTDQHIWSQQYDRELKNIFAVQSDIAKQVADSLRIRIVSPEIARIEKKPTASTTAYTLYLKGRFLWNTRGLQEVKDAIGFFERAIKEDPDFALGYVGLADCHLILRSNWKVDPDTSLEKAKTMLARAIELDPTLAEAHATMGNLLENEYRLREAEEKYKAAIRLKPSYAFAHMWYYNTLHYQLRWDEALEQIEKAVELDPLSPVICFNHAHYYLSRKEYAKALELSKRVVELDPSNAGGYGSMGFAYAKMNQFNEMERCFERVVELTKDAFPSIGKAMKVNAAYLKDDKQTVRRLLPELEDHIGETFMDTYSLAGLYVFLGEIDKGFELLERAYSKKDWGLLRIRLDEELDSIRADARYHDLLRRLELS